MVFEKSIKPCRIIGFCPYGPLVENMPLPEEPNERCCKIFGHECPIFYAAEPFVDPGEVTEDDVEAQIKELRKYWSE